MDAETTRLRDATTALKAEEKELRLALREGTAQVPLPEIRSAVARLEQEKTEMAARLKTLKSGSVKPVSLEERDKINSDHKKWQTAAASRKRIRADMWDMVSGTLEKDKLEETKEALGLEF
jgi:26S proteasome regulatory subunit, ATPase 3, interacting protein